jgi:probable HAF family extracellular repeat protein
MIVRQKLAITIILIFVTSILFSCKNPTTITNPRPQTLDFEQAGKNTKNTGKSVWAYGNHSFEKERKSGWIYELSSDQASTELIARRGNGIPSPNQEDDVVGNLLISKWNNLLQIAYNAYPGYLFENLYLWVGCSIDDLPLKGNSDKPFIKEFPYKYKKEQTDYHVFTIDLSNYNCAGSVFISAHASKIFETGTNPGPVNPNVTIQDLGYFPTTEDVDFIDEANATAVNDQGVVVGNQWYTVCLSENCGTYYFENQPFIWSPVGGLERLPWIDFYFGFYPATDINNNGDVAGFSDSEGALYFDSSAPIWSGVTGLGSLFGGDRFFSNALAVNDFAQVVGFAENPTGQQRAFIWSKSEGITDLGTLPGHSHSAALDINNKGQVVGWSQNTMGDSSDRRYFLWDKTNGMTDLGTEPALSINDHGQISGANAINNLGQMVNEDGTFTDPDIGLIGLTTLQDSGTCRALNLNNTGQIVGSCKRNGIRGPEIAAVLWELEYPSNIIVRK